MYDSESYQNSTFQAMYASPIPAWLLMSINTLVIVTAVLGNGVLIVSFVAVSSLRKVSNYFVVSLATVDILIGIVAIPVMFGVGAVSSWAVCVVYYTVDISVCCVSVFHILAINVDRYLAITRPLHYPTLATPKRVACIIPCLWILGVGASVAHTTSGMVDLRDCSVPTYTKVGSLVSMFCLFFTPFVVTTFIYFRIYRLVAEHLKTIQGRSMAASTPATANELVIRNPEGHLALPAAASYEVTPSISGHRDTGVQPDGKQNRRSAQMSNRKAIKVIALILGIFGVAWGNFYIILTIGSFSPRLQQDPVLLGLSAMSIVLLYVSSAANPFIYGFYSSEFRAAFVLVLKCKCKKRGRTEPQR